MFTSCQAYTNICSLILLFLVVIKAAGTKIDYEQKVKNQSVLCVVQNDKRIWKNVKSTF